MHTYAIKSISQTDREAMQQKLDQLAKPIAGLGRLEKLAVTIAGFNTSLNYRYQNGAVWSLRPIMVSPVKVFQLLLKR